MLLVGVLLGYCVFVVLFVLLWHELVSERDEPSLVDELEDLEDGLEPAFQWPPRWKDDAHIELPNRERIGLRGPEIEHVAERVVQTRRAV